MSESQQDDIYDYPMSDTFISETRRVPYRRGFRSRPHPQNPPLSYINALSEQEFTAYRQNGFRLPSDGSDHQSELNELWAVVQTLVTTVQTLQAELDAFRHSMTIATPNRSPIQGGGLDVPSRD